MFEKITGHSLVKALTKLKVLNIEEKKSKFEKTNSKKKLWKFQGSSGKERKIHLLAGKYVGRVFKHLWYVTGKYAMQ